jgi:ferric-dicitrate binding protein FerR (iron transport regulator)
MNLTKEIIDDLIPLYAANECSADTRKLVEEYLQQNPQRAEEIKRILQTPLPRAVPPPASLDETRALREARRRLSRQQWLMGAAIFFSLAPLAFFHEDGRTWWLLRDSPKSALIYAALAVVFWVIYAVERRHPRSV